MLLAQRATKSLLDWPREATDLSKNRYGAFKYTLFYAWKLYTREQSLLKKYLKESNLIMANK